MTHINFCELSVCCTITPTASSQVSTNYQLKECWHLPHGRGAPTVGLVFLLISCLRRVCSHCACNPDLFHLLVQLHTHTHNMLFWAYLSTSEPLILSFEFRNERLICGMHTQIYLIDCSKILFFRCISPGKLFSYIVLFNSLAIFFCNMNEMTCCWQLTRHMDFFGIGLS